MQFCKSSHIFKLLEATVVCVSKNMKEIISMHLSLHLIANNKLIHKTDQMGLPTYLDKCCSGNNLLVNCFYYYRKGHRLINSVFRLTTTLHIPLPIPFLNQKELRSTSLNFEHKSENFAAILNDKSSAGVVFICKENHYYCHKIILCSRIHLFRELFG